MRNKLPKHIFSAVLFCVVLSMGSCMEWDYQLEEDFESSQHGLFIINEGNFQYGNASLSFYDPSVNMIENEVFYRANGMKLGDVAQSMTIHGDKGWIVVNNSHVIFAIDTKTFKEKGRIENLTSPRYIHFVSDRKAYVTQLWDNRICIIDPRSYEITGYITVEDMEMQTGSTEYMVQVGRYVYCSCWSYQNSIIKIDTETDEIVDRITVGIQPSKMVVDKYDRLWVTTDGGYEGSPYGYEAPTLCLINLDNFEIDLRFTFKLGDNVSGLTTDNSGDKLYWINDAVWCMDIDDASLPRKPFLESRSTKYYSLTVSPYNSDIYVADAIDYQQAGIIYRYSATGRFLDEFYVGITPSSFCWK